MSLEIAAFLIAAIAAIYGIFTAQLIKSEDKRVKEMLQCMDERHLKLLEKMKTEDEEARRRHEELMRQWRSDQQEAINYLARLISEARK